MKKVITILVVFVLIGLTVTGCEKRAKDYIGKYVDESEGFYSPKKVLEIKEDGTYRLAFDYQGSSLDSTVNGKWKIIGNKIVLHRNTGITEIEGEIKKGILIDHFENRTFIKQN